MAVGSRLGLLVDRIGSTIRDGAKLTEDEASKLGMKNTTGARVLDTIKDTMFTGKANEATGDLGASLTSRVVGGAIGVGGVAAAGVGFQSIQDHPVLGTGIIGAAALTAMSTPRGIMDAAQSISKRMSHFANAEEAEKVTARANTGIPNYAGMGKGVSLTDLRKN